MQEFSRKWLKKIGWNQVYFLLEKAPPLLILFLASFLLSYFVNSILEIRMLPVITSLESQKTKKIVEKKRETPPPETRQFSEEIIRIDVFDAIPDVQPAVVQNIPLPPLNLTLLGTIVGRTPYDSFAIIQDPKGTSGIYTTGDTCAEGVTVAEIHVDRVVLARAGSTQTIFLYEEKTFKDLSPSLPPPSPVFSPGEEGRTRPPLGRERRENITVVQEGDKFILNASEVKEVMEDMGKILTEARIVPYIKDGETDGYKIFAVRPGSLFERIGLNNGDVIKMVNGMKIKSPQEALELFRQLKDETEFEIVIERGGVTKTLRYAIR